MLKSYFNNIIHFIVTVISLILIVVLVLFSNKTGQLVLEVDKVSEDDIYAPRSIIDVRTTNENKQAARNNVKDVYVHDASKKDIAVEKITSVFDTAKKIRSDEDIDINEATHQLMDASKIENLSYDTARELITASNREFSEMRKSIDIVNTIMSQEISDISLAKEQYESDIQILGLTVTPKQQKALTDLIGGVVTVNLEIDKEKTEAERDAAEKAVPDVEYKKNQIIVAKGEVVTEAHIEMLITFKLLH